MNALQTAAASDNLTRKIAELVDHARNAMAEYQCFDQARVDEVVTAIAWTIVNPVNNRMLAEMAVADTGIGNVEDKVRKNRRKTMGLLRDLQNAPSVGVIHEDVEKGIIEIARPVGVVATLTPSTNPVATPVNKTMNALKGRNAVILAPSPKGLHTCEVLVELMRGELKRVGAPQDLIQVLPSPVSKQSTQELMRQADLVVVTGSQNNVHGAYSSGTPALGVGAGNVSVIVDETADAESAAAKIVSSKTFDNATSCSSENSVVVVDSAYADLKQALEQEGCVFLTQAEADQLQEKLWESGRLSAALTAKSAGHIAEAVGLGRSETHTAKVLVVEPEGIGSKHPFSGEKLSPVLALYKADSFSEAKRLVADLMDYQGKGHSVGLHSKESVRALELGLELEACRVIVNQAHCFATGGSFDNGLPFSLSMGCGTWGGNSFSDNLNYKHYLNTVRISTPIAPKEPTESELFGSYKKKFGLEE